MRNWYLFLAALAVANAVPPIPTKTKSCIDSCKCKFTKLPSRLQIIDCDGPLVLNDTTFQYINKRPINVLSLENVIINQIQEGAFKDFENLDDIVILQSKIGSIDDKAFNNIKRLKFSGCGFEDSPDLFSEKLEELHFGDCQLEEIPNLNNLLSLRFLNLSGNYIKNIDIDAFATLFNLEELSLADNEIFKLPPTIFINNLDLNSLTLDNNPLRHFNLNTSENLEYLSLKNCQLEVFDEISTQRLSTLSELILSHNNIRELSSNTFARMRELSTINLSYNKLENLEADLFSNNKDLIKITLDGNNFKSLPNFKPTGEGDFSTYTLSCKYCGLKTLPGSVFQDMAGMITLDLSNNKLTSVEGTFEKIESLKHLDISNNNISKLTTKTFSSNRDLETLNLAGNPLKVVDPAVFVKNLVLREIDLRNASLTKLWSNSSPPLKYLHKILLSDNQLSSLSFDDLEVMPTIEAIDLNNNPLVFNDDFCNLILILQKKEVSPIENTKNLFADVDKAFGEDIDGFTIIEWKEFYQKKCPQIDIKDSDFFYDINESESYDEDDGDDNDTEDDDDYNDNYDDNYSETVFLKKQEQAVAANSNLAKASYILSITSVFILSALVVLTVAVTVTLCVLRRSNNFNMHTANLPRLKIPLWSTAPSQKKHSGSVYRPLSEDLSGPKTPKLSRYEFAASPTVHASNP